MLGEKNFFPSSYGEIPSRKIFLLKEKIRRHSASGISKEEKQVKRINNPSINQL
jgi:hypothetical protein